MYIPLPSSPLIYSPSPRTFKWDGVEFYQSPNLQQLQHFAVLLALHGLCKSAGILSHKDYFKMRRMVFIVHVAVLEAQSHGARTGVHPTPLLKEINFVKTTYINL